MIQRELFSLKKSEGRSATVFCDKTVAHCNYHSFGRPKLRVNLITESYRQRPTTTDTGLLVLLLKLRSLVCTHGQTWFDVIRCGPMRYLVISKADKSWWGWFEITKKSISNCDIKYFSWFAILISNPMHLILIANPYLMDFDVGLIFRNAKSFQEGKIPVFLPRCMECSRGIAMGILSVRPSVCLSVRQTRALWQNGRKLCLDFYIIWKNIYPSFLSRRMVGGDDPFYLKFWVNRPALERNRRFWTDNRS